VKHFFELMACFVTVGKAGRGPHIAGYEELISQGNYTAGTPPAAGCPFGNCIADFHEVFIPAGPFVSGFSRGFCQALIMIMFPGLLNMQANSGLAGQELAILGPTI
jgi:hypothetical protein